MRSSQGALETQQTQIMHSCFPQGCTQPAPRFLNAGWEKVHKSWGRHTNETRCQLCRWMDYRNIQCCRTFPTRKTLASDTSEHSQFGVLVEDSFFAYFQWIHVWQWHTWQWHTSQWHGLPDQCVQSNPWQRLAKPLCADMAHVLQL